jgi:hypothetical protein
MTDVIKQEEAVDNTNLDCMDIYKTADINNDGVIEVTEVVQYILHSKTIWINMIALGSFVIQTKFGFIVAESAQLEMLSAINVMLRMGTSKRIVYTKQSQL